MLQALETQLTSGPLADLTAGTVDGNGFVTEVQSLEASYAQNVDQQLLPEFPNVDTLLKLQGERIVADETSLNQQYSVGLLSRLPGRDRGPNRHQLADRPARFSLWTRR